VRSPLCPRHAAWLAALLVVAAPVGARAVDGRIVAVHDGDTVTLLDGGRVQHRVRIAGIDAPERGQPFGDAARQGLAQLVQGKRVEARCHKRDRYGREVCVLFVGTQDVGLEQVRNGLAWWYRDYAREQSAGDRASYEAAELEARGARRGLWRDANPQPPASWRKGRVSRAPATS
jgi:endonuclease YncB( thermonuclease family)